MKSLMEEPGASSPRAGVILAVSLPPAAKLISRRLARPSWLPARARAEPRLLTEMREAAKSFGAIGVPE
ncbi:hypothetical protein NL676_020615 [Syzygium grande]|nr:hypothetical protein NL676_020615 [Syzygium grande]